MDRCSGKPSFISFLGTGIQDEGIERVGKGKFSLTEHLTLCRARDLAFCSKTCHSILSSHRNVNSEIGEAKAQVRGVKAGHQGCAQCPGRQT